MEKGTEEDMSGDGTFYVALPNDPSHGCQVLFSSQDSQGGKVVALNQHVTAFQRMSRSSLAFVPLTLESKRCLTVCLFRRSHENGPSECKGHMRTLRGEVTVAVGPRY